MAKHFVFGEKKQLSKEVLVKVQKDSQEHLTGSADLLDIKAAEKLKEEDFLIHAEGRVVVKLDIENKNYHTFEDGTKIRRERLFNQFNRRIAQPVNCIVISGEGIPKDAELLVDHNAFHETNRINDYKNLFESEDSDRVRYFSLERYECYAWRVGNEKWNPIYPYEFALRVFKPYTGVLENIEPELLKDTLFVTSGSLSGNVVKTLKGCDYEIIYQNTSGREGNLICFRPMGDDKRKLEEEAICILHELTDKINNGEYLIGYEIKDAKQLNKNVPIP